MPELSGLSDLAGLRAAVDAYRTPEPAGDGSWLPEPWDRLLGPAVRAGAVVSVRGKRAGLSAALALLAAVIPAGGWCGVVGVPGLGIAAAAGLGVPADRLVLVPRPGAAWEQVCGTLLPAVSALLVHVPGSVPPRVAARVAAKARAARCTLITVGTAWPGSASLAVTGAHWYGPASGQGRLTHRRVKIVRDAGGRSDSWLVLLPDRHGHLTTTLDDPRTQHRPVAPPPPSPAPGEPVEREDGGAGERSA